MTKNDVQNIQKLSKHILEKVNSTSSKNDDYLWLRSQFNINLSQKEWFYSDVIKKKKRSSSVDNTDLNVERRELEWLKNTVIVTQNLL